MTSDATNSLRQKGLRRWVIVPSDVGGNRRGQLNARDHDRDLAVLRAAWSRFK